MSVPPNESEIKRAFVRDAESSANRQQGEQMREALQEAISAIQVFHGPGWEIYRDHSPEMKRWKALLAASRPDAVPKLTVEQLREEIRNALICDQTTGAGDYDEAVAYAERIVGKAAKDNPQDTQDQSRTGLLLEAMKALHTKLEQIIEVRGERDKVLIAAESALALIRALGAQEGEQ